MWLTPELQQQLEPFESAIRTIGNHERLVNDHPALEQRQQYIDEMFTLFAKVVGEKEWQGKVVTGEVAVSAILQNFERFWALKNLQQFESN